MNWADCVEEVGGRERRKVQKVEDACEERVAEE